MSKEIVYLDRFEIADGKSDQFRRFVEELVRLVEENRPGAISINYGLDEGGQHGTAVFVFADAAAFDRYLDLVSPRFRESVELLASTDIELLGRPSDRATAMAKAFNATVKPDLVGLHR
jgi:quinol monooxygenase YgiN